jgi:DNA-binding GntR family transcriptional regulator
MADIAEREAALAAAIRKDLGAGLYEAGARLGEVSLAARYGAPRAAIRNALITLAAEGLVERQPNLGARVRTISVGEGIELAETRRELESLNAAYAAERATDAERRRIEELMRRLEAAAADDHDEYRSTSPRFHEVVNTASHHATSIRILSDVRRHRLDRLFPDAFPRSTGQSLPKHLAIGTAILDRDADAAGSVMREHVTTIVAFLEAYKVQLEASTENDQPT